MNKKKQSKKQNQLQRRRLELDIGELAQVYGGGGIVIQDAGTKDNNNTI